MTTAHEMAAALAAGHVSSVELVQRTLALAEAWQPFTNSFSQLWADKALDDARRVDGVRLLQGAAPLAGVPIAVKDLFDVAGHDTTGCCAAYRGALARRDAVTISRLRSAGLVIVGKTNQHELAAGGTNAVSACGRTGNPWSPERMTGGSSGGSAAAVTAGVVPWSLGSDTGGSIRIPSSMCGAFGLKPTTGRVPTEGMLPLAPSLDCPGPIASSLEDVWALHELTAGGGSGPGVSSQGIGAHPRDPFRIGVPDGFFSEQVHPEVSRAVAGVGEALKAGGGIVEPVDGRGIEDARRAWTRICYSEFAAAHPMLFERRELVSPSVMALMDYGSRLSAEHVAQARERRRSIATWFRDRLSALDALLIPTTPYPAPRHDQSIVDIGGGHAVDVDVVGPGWFTCTVNLAGLPALNLPAGRSSDGLPVGVSLVGKEDAELTLARLAGVWQSETGYRAPSTPLPAGAGAPSE